MGCLTDAGSKEASSCMMKTLGHTTSRSPARGRVHVFRCGLFLFSPSICSEPLFPVSDNLLRGWFRVIIPGGSFNLCLPGNTSIYLNELLKLLRDLSILINRLPRTGRFTSGTINAFYRIDQQLVLGNRRIIPGVYVNAIHRTRLPHRQCPFCQYIKAL